MDFLYSAAAAALLLLTLPYWLVQLARRPKYRAGLAERLGRVPPRVARVSDPRARVEDPCHAIWVHAVSVGELLAVSGVVRELRARYPGRRVLVSTTTETGQTLARERFGEENALYFPLDFGFAIRPYLRTLRPELVVIAETELWPNFLRLAHQSGARVAVINARVSDRSFPRYRRFKRLLRPVLARVDLFLAQGDEDAQRLVEIGAPAERVRACGNLKFDLVPPPEAPLVAQLRQSFSGPVLVCGSTVEGEEELLVNSLRAVWDRFPRTVMVLAPRHPERFAAVADLLAASGVRFWKRSKIFVGSGEKPTRPKEALSEPPELSGGVLLLDSIGELAAVYELAMLAFVGGSLVPRGGHNILEPARCGVATVVGPHTENFRDIVDVFRRAEAVRVADAQHLASVWLEWLENDALRRQSGERARRTLEQNAGATARTMLALESLLRETAVGVKA
jgi:3-deoxy-D-manno-octulosonic-acid transferase